MRFIDHISRAVRARLTALSRAHLYKVDLEAERVSAIQGKIQRGGPWGG